MNMSLFVKENPTHRVRSRLVSRSNYCPKFFINQAKIFSDFDVVVSPKWHKNDRKYQTCNPPKPQSRYTWNISKEWCEILQSLASKDNFKLTVFVETSSKPFNEWIFKCGTLWNSMGIAMIWILALMYIPLLRVIVPTLRMRSIKKRYVNFWLQTCITTSPIDVIYEAKKSINSYSYLASATYHQVKIIPKKLIEGKIGTGILITGSNHVRLYLLRTKIWYERHGKNPWSYYLAVGGGTKSGLSSWLRQGEKIKEWPYLTKTD